MSLPRLRIEADGPLRWKVYLNDFEVPALREFDLYLVKGDVPTANLRLLVGEVEVDAEVMVTLLAEYQKAKTA